MIFDELKENLSQIDEGFHSYVDSSREYYRLSAFKFLMKTVSALAKWVCVGFIALLALLLLSLAASYGIGQALNNTFYGFLCVGLFYILVGIIFYLLKNRIDRPLLRKFSEYYFDEL
ncbi:hypothetical protein K8352_00480 [Flavobacteriaceae bacterium F89]|uniref:Uncharacterized protein n=1 Tax=Cerina litoralis TaxID=2874477 RepID=A0AAE3ETD6_9FLAO|nr:hypothetical protein [Cerina litoralis]MCG2459216.1 hypothetical protein [Cerina litoralis]